MCATSHSYKCYIQPGLEKWHAERLKNRWRNQSKEHEDRQDVRTRAKMRNVGGASLFDRVYEPIVINRINGLHYIWNSQYMFISLTEASS